MKTASLLLTLVLLAISSANAGNNYYPRFAQNLFAQESIDSEELKEALFNVLTQTHQKSRKGPDTLGCKNSGNGACYSQRSLGYKGARKVLFGNLHLEEDRKGYYVRDVYCDKEFRKSQTRVGPNTIPNNTILNCEHTWPQSKFSRRFDKGLQRADLHHLFPTDTKANSRRGNVEFDNVRNARSVKGCSAAKYDAQNGRFEPPTFHKGNVARALFYFSVRYQMPISSKQERVLKQWHILDPVDAEEMDRNDMIFNVQGNRNPFIDYPELVDSISDF